MHRNDDKDTRWHKKFMTDATVWILKDLDLSPSELTVLIHVVHGAGRGAPDFICEKTKGDLTKDTGFDWKTVDKCLARLRHLGIIEAIRSRGSNREAFIVSEFSDWKQEAWKKGSNLRDRFVRKTMEPFQ
jgi:DNA-binding MarR family transcriptional regulator